MYKSFTDFLRDVHAAGLGRRNAYVRLKTAGHLEEGQDSMGGFTVPTEFYDEIMNVALEESIVRPRARVIPCGSNAIGIPTIVDTTHASTVFGGFSAAWKGEAVARTADDIAIGQLGLKMKELTGFCYTSERLLADSGGLCESLLRQAFGEAVAYYADDAYINGTGVFRPMGILNAPCTITRAKETSQAAATLQIENVFGMASRLLPQCHRKAVWLAHPDTLPQWGSLMADMRYNGPGFYILGKEVIWTEKCATLGTKGDVYLVDFSKYVIADGGLVVSTSKHYQFVSNEIAWRFVLKTDGQPILASAITPKNGTTTLSPFVVLAARG